MPLERASGFSILMQRRHGGRKDLSSSALRNAEWRASLNLVLVRTWMLIMEICQIEKYNNVTFIATLFSRGDPFYLFLMHFTSCSLLFVDGSVTGRNNH